MKINPAVVRTAPPPIPLAQGWKAAYLAASSPAGPMLDLSQGVPSAPPPEAFVRSLIDVVKDPSSARYGGILGEPVLREALQVEWKNVYDPAGKWPEALAPAASADEAGAGVGVRPQDLGVVCGANMAFMATLLTLCQSGDSIILPTPHYFNQSMTGSLLSIKTLPLPCDPPSFVPSVSAARTLLEHDQAAAGGGKCRAIVLVSPNNPTGAVYLADVLADFARLAKEKDVALVIDETYRDFLAPVPGDGGAAGELVRAQPHALFDNPEWRETVVSLFSFSKSYKIPGHRLGVICAGAAVLEQVSTVLDCMQINPPRPSQLAIAPLLPSLRPSLVETSQRYAVLLELFAAQLPPAWTLLSTGAFYAFVQHPFKGVKAAVVGSVLALKHGVVVLPGGFFMPPAEEGGGGGEDWLRFAVANISAEEIALLGPRLAALTAADFA